MNILNCCEKFYYEKIRKRIIWTFVLFYLPSGLCAQQLNEFPIFGSDTSISLHVGGVVDAVNTRKYQDESVFRYGGSGLENNISFCLENKGSRDIINPRIDINGKRMVYTMGDLLSRIPLNQVSTIDDTVKVLWQFLWNNYNHWLVSTEAGTYQIKPVKTFNVYGAGQCENVAQVICSMLKYLGYKNVYPIGLNYFHTVGLLKVNGRSIILDSDLKTFYTKRDNRTLADIDSVIWDREFASRQHHGGFEASEVVSDDDIARGYTDLKRTGYTSNYQDWANPDTMSLRIRPGEQFVFNYDSSVGKYFCYYHSASDYNSDRAIPPNSSLGIVRYKPTCSSAWLNSITYSENAESSDSVIYAADSSKTASVIIDFKNPYVWTNGKIAISCSKDSKGFLKISGKKDYQNDYTLLYEIDSLFLGHRTDTINLFEFIKPNNYPYRGDPMTNLYYVKIEWLAERSKGITIDSLYFENNFQLNPNALPRLNLGDNTIHITNQNGEPFEGLIYSHRYKEINNYSIPIPPANPIFPVSGGVVNSSQFEFMWELPGGISSNEITDFNIQVSEYPDFRFPVSSTFNKLTSQQHDGSIPKWKVPGIGLLNPQTTYYWRVAVRNNQGVWSDWSKVWSFTIDAVGVPLDPSYENRGDSLVVKWKANPIGKQPAKFYVLASNERGFSYDDSLIIDSTENNFYTIKNASKILSYAFYRIVATDMNDSKSGVSDLIAIEDRLLCGNIPSVIQSSDSLNIKLVKIEPVDFYGRSGPPDYTAHMVCDSLVIISVLLPRGLTLENSTIRGKITSYGDTIIEINGQTIQSNKEITKRIKLSVNASPKIVGLSKSVAKSDSSFQSKIIADDPDEDSLFYFASNLPQWLHLDSTSGIFSGTPSLDDVGDYFISMSVRDINGGMMQSGFKITVLSPSPYFAIQSVDDSIVKVGQTSELTTNVVVDSGYNGQIQYQLRVAPDWLIVDSLSGKISAHPSIEDYGKDYLVRVRATDINHLYSDYTFSIHVSRENTFPQFLTFPDTVCYYGTSYKYQVKAFDADTLFKDSVVKYVLLKGPYWLKMDDTGLLSGVVSDPTVKNYKAAIGVIDAFGDTSLQTFKLYVHRAYVLQQNYPNPFSGNTTIRFELPKRSYVKLEIFNSSGQNLGILAQSRYDAGYHEITWDAGSNWKGVYFVVATINRPPGNKKIRLVRKMILVKH